MLHLLFRCQCGWEEADHEPIKTDMTGKLWEPNDVKLEDTNAYGEIEFRGAGKCTRAKVTLEIILMSKAIF